MKRRIMHGIWRSGMSTTLCGRPHGFDHTRWAVAPPRYAEVTCKACRKAIERDAALPRSPAAQKDHDDRMAGVS